MKKGLKLRIETPSQEVFGCILTEEAGEIDEMSPQSDLSRRFPRVVVDSLNISSTRRASELMVEDADCLLL